MPRYKRFDDLADEMKKFVIENIDKEKKDEKESLKLERKYFMNQDCCSSNNSAELEHWNQLRLLIMYKYKNIETKTCFCMPHMTKRYLKHGIPSIILPSMSHFVIQILYLSFYAISAIIQVIKAQMDSRLSAYAQICLIFGSIFAMIFFGCSNNYIMIIPPFLNILYACLLLFGIYNNCDQDILCVFSEL